MGMFDWFKRQVFQRPLAVQVYTWNTSTSSPHQRGGPLFDKVSISVLTMENDWRDKRGRLRCGHCGLLNSSAYACTHHRRGQ
jgi:hypothetical protein